MHLLLTSTGVSPDLEGTVMELFGIITLVLISTFLLIAFFAAARNCFGSN